MKPIITLCALLVSASITFAADGDKPKGPPPEGGPRPNPEEMFKRLDTNGDGAISKEEFLASPRAQKDPEKATLRFEEADKDKDGKLTKDEMKSLRGKGGPGRPPGEGPPGKSGEAPPPPPPGEKPAAAK